MANAAIALTGSLLFAGLCGCASSPAQPATHPAALSATHPAERPAAATSTCPPGHGFALSLASSVGGEATPEGAAVAFARRGAVMKEPVTGWKVTAHTDQGATVQSGTYQLNAVQGPDGTWQVDSGRCT